eukprot:scpid51270/ scgid28748/ 2,3-bisphosphoglycerate-independent phosphoglycerate mutase
MSVCLVVIDGWGISDNVEGNAIANASTPVMDALSQGTYTTLDASGLAVGLPDGLMGNSEVGHMTIGCGRAIYQDIVRINISLSENTLKDNANLLQAFERCKSGNGRLHFVGLVSDGGVHSHINHLLALLECAKLHQVPNTFVQFFSDGRDTRPTSGVTYLQQLLDHIERNGYGELASVTGRYYAMDRDKRFERIKIAYEGLVNGDGHVVDSAADIIPEVQARYAAEGDKRQTDEFITPILVKGQGRIQDGDTLVFIDYRADRMREIVEALGDKPQFETSRAPQNLQVTTMTQYKEGWTYKTLFPPQQPINTLAEWLGKKSRQQFHCAETEKYAHVTFFFNGGREAAFEGEERCMVPSPKVATYDLQPEMNAAGVAEKVAEAVRSGRYPLTMCNFAPPDMVGHTGKYEPTIVACEATDRGIGLILQACQESNCTLMVTADHGNAEKMFSEQGGPHTAHTTYRVPLCISGPKQLRELKHNASLQDVAPTVLQLLGLEIPSEMTGQPLLDM